MGLSKGVEEVTGLMKNVSTSSTNFLTYLWNWALLEKLPIVQLLKNFQAFYDT
jgi:hypothetical protein